MILSFWTDRYCQTVKTQIRLLEEQSDPGLHCLPFHLHRLDAFLYEKSIFEPQHDKTNKLSVRPAKTEISLVIRPVRSKSSLSARRKLVSLATHWVHSKNSDQTGRMPRLIWVFAGHTVTLLVLSCRGSYVLSVWIFRSFMVIILGENCQ